MNVLLTGATGYLGSALARALVSVGNRVVVLKRQASDLRFLQGLLHELACYDLEKDGMSSAFADERFDVVVHTATCYGRSGEAPGEVFAANTAWPLQLLESAATAGVPLFINTDTSLPREMNSYSLSKKQFRDWGSQISGNGDICFLNILLEHFYGPGDMETKFVTRVIRCCLLNEPELLLTSGVQRRDFIHIDDVVAAYLLLAERFSAAGPGFVEAGLGSGDAVPVRELVEKIRELTRSASLLKFGVVPLRKDEAMLSVADTALLRSLGWKPRVSLADGLVQTIAQEKKLMERTMT